MARIVGHLSAQVDTLCVEHCALIRRSVSAYRGDNITDEELFDTSRAHALELINAIGSGTSNTGVSERLGRLRAEQGVPLADVMTVYRVSSCFWAERLTQAKDRGDFSERELLVAVSEVWRHHSECIDAMAASYRRELSRQARRHSSIRSDLVRGLLDAQLPDSINFWEALRSLGLPESGWLVVVAVDTTSVGDVSQPILGSVLDAIYFVSAWWVTDDLQYGIVMLRGPDRLSRLSEVLRTVKRVRIGISPVYEVGPIPRAGLKYARAALRATTSDQRLVVFSEDPYAVAAVGDPETMSIYCRTVLGTLLELNRFDKAVLLDTFRQWVATGGSVRLTAEKLSCHPNTVRYRLRKLKDITGRDIGRPRGCAELCLAAEVEKRVEIPER